MLSGLKIVNYSRFILINQLLIRIFGTKYLQFALLHMYMEKYYTMTSME